MTKALLLLVLLASLSTYGQKTRQPFWIGPANVKVNGILFSPIVYNSDKQTHVNGLDIQGLGLPIFLFMMPKDPIAGSTKNGADSLLQVDNYHVNGIVISPDGLMIQGNVNGLSVTPCSSYIYAVNGAHIGAWMSMCYKINGLTTGLYNTIYYMNGVELGVITSYANNMRGLEIACVNDATNLKGVQIGLINHADSCKGLQIGFWNINERRKLPLVNW
jgi:hypothetical protein